MSGRFEMEQRIDEKIEAKLYTMPWYASEWHLNMKASRKTASTRLDFLNKLDHFLEYINADNVYMVKPSDFNKEILKKYFIDIQTREKNGVKVQTSDSYQISTWACLNNFFSFMENEGYIAEVYTKYIQKPANRDLDRVNANRIKLTDKDFQKIIKAVDANKYDEEKIRDKAILLVFMTTGMRRSALINIELDDLDLKKKTLTVVDKERKTHTYVINDTLAAALKDWLNDRWRYVGFEDDDKHLFLSKRGNALSRETVVKVVKKYSKKGIGIELSPHKLRAGVATIIYDKTHDAEFTRRFIGHSNIATTQRYIVTNGEEREEGAEMLNRIFK